MSEHCHVHALIKRKDGESELVEFGGRIQINGGDILEAFSYCPTCGKALSFNIFMSGDYYLHMVEKSATDCRDISEYRNKLEKYEKKNKRITSKN